MDLSIGGVTGSWLMNTLWTVRAWIIVLVRTVHTITSTTRSTVYLLSVRLSVDYRYVRVIHTRVLYGIQNGRYSFHILFPPPIMGLFLSGGLHTPSHLTTPFWYRFFYFRIASSFELDFWEGLYCIVHIVLCIVLYCIVLYWISLGLLFFDSIVYGTVRYAP